MINSRHTGMIIWIIKILRGLHDTFYKQNALSLASRQRVGMIPERLQSLENAGLLRYGIAPWQQNDNILDYPRIKSYLISVREVR